MADRVGDQWTAVIRRVEGLHWAFACALRAPLIDGRRAISPSRSGPALRHRAGVGFSGVEAPCAAAVRQPRSRARRLGLDLRSGPRAPLPCCERPVSGHASAAGPSTSSRTRSRRGRRKVRCPRRVALAPTPTHAKWLWTSGPDGAPGASASNLIRRGWVLLSHALHAGGCP